MKVRVGIAMVLITVAIISLRLYEPLPDPLWNGRKTSGWTADLFNDDPEIQTRALAALKQIGQPAARHLAKSLQQPPVQIPPAFASIANRVPFLRENPNTTAAAQVRAIAALGELGPAAAPALPEIINLLADSSDKIIAEAEQLLRRIGPAAAPVLAANLQSSSKIIRARVARTLADFPSEQTFSALIKSLNDDFYEVRANAAESLGRLRATNSVPTLLAALNDMDHRVRARACNALGAIGDKTATAKVLLLRRDAFPEVRFEAAKAVWKISHDPAPILPILTQLLETKQSWQAAYTLAEMRADAAPAIPALIEAMRREQVPRPFRAVSSATFALGQIGQPAIPALIQALSDKNKIHRANAAMALAFMEKTAGPAEPALLNIVKDQDDNLRQAAALTLGRIGSTDPRAIRALSDCLRAEDIFLRSQALTLLRELAPDREWAVSLSD
jgi:HEAT repeat protein